METISRKYPNFKPDDGVDALRYLSDWAQYRRENCQMYIVNSDDEELMDYYKQFDGLTRSWLWKSDRAFDDSLILKFGYPMPLSSNKLWQIILYIYSNEYMRRNSKDTIPELWPKYKIVEYIPGTKEETAIMTKSQYQNEWENVLWYITTTIADYAKKKARVVITTSSPSSHMDRYFRDRYSRSKEKDPYLTWFDTAPEDDCTCTASGLIWKKQMKQPSSLGTAEVAEKSDGLFVKVDYSNLSNMCKATLNQRFGLLSGDFDGDTPRVYCKSDVNSTVELLNQLEKETRELMKKYADNNESKMEAEPFKPMAWLAIEKVIFNNEATIVIWNDGKKTIVKCQEGETFDKEKGIAMAICKRALGNSPYFNNYFKKWISEAKVENSKVKKADKKRKKEVSKLADIMLTETDTEKIANAIENSKKVIDNSKEANI